MARTDGRAAPPIALVLCFAHVTNKMWRIERDLEKGALDGAEESLKVISVVAGRWRTERWNKAEQVIEALGDLAFWGIRRGSWPRQTLCRRGFPNWAS